MENGPAVYVGPMGNEVRPQQAKTSNPAEGEAVDSLDPMFIAIRGEKFNPSFFSILHREEDS